MFRDSPYNTTVKSWISEFKMGQTRQTEKPHGGPSHEVTTLENICKSTRQLCQIIEWQSSRYQRLLAHQWNMCGISYMKTRVWSSYELVRSCISSTLTKNDVERMIQQTAHILYVLRPNFCVDSQFVNKTWFHQNIPETKQWSKRTTKWLHRETFAMKIKSEML